VSQDLDTSCAQSADQPVPGNRDRLVPEGPRRFGPSWFSYGSPGGWLRGGPGGRSRAFPALVWLGFIIFPLVNAIASSEPVVQHVLIILGAATFIAAYVGLILTWRLGRWQPASAVLLVVLLGTAAALTLGDAPGWGFLFTYCAAVVAMFSPASFGWLGVITCAVLAAACTLLGGGNAGTAISFAVTSLGIGLLMVLMRDLRMRNIELSEARAELARTAVAQERERFARDLHDLLGHTLSVIALKAELAGRLMADRPEQAATEIGEVEGVARQALSEVRLAVSGYRQPTLEGELAGARMALSAAGIETDVDAPKLALTPEVEAVLAWAVREGATNVIRHSGASHCTMRVSAGLVDAAVEVIDDGGPHESAAVRARWSRAGVGAEASNDAGAAIAPWGAVDTAGHGLAGLRERAEALRGRVEAGALPGGGFKLMVSVPLSAAAS
jgi:two-component system, NarL family, sensor histidine kinase DesK